MGLYGVISGKRYLLVSMLLYEGTYKHFGGAFEVPPREAISADYTGLGYEAFCKQLLGSKVCWV